MRGRTFGTIRVGDLVVPVDGREFLYTTPDKIELEEDPIDIVWDDDAFGIVINVEVFDPPQDYYQIRVVVGDVVGWTYSDYVKPIWGVRSC